MPCTCEAKTPAAFDFVRLDLPNEACNSAESFLSLQDSNEVDDCGLLNLQLNEPEARLNAGKAQAAPVSVKKSMAVFDWDDTLLATTHLAAAGYRLGQTRPQNPTIAAALEKLDVAAQAILNLALEQCHHVCIITNAEAGWVELSSQAWLPGVAAMLSRVNLISARSTYERFHPNSPMLWKWRAFQDCTRKFHEKHCDDLSILHILSFGDSNVEREVTRTIASSRTNTKAKTVKFMDQPTPEDLHKQLLLMASRFQTIVSHEADLDLTLPVH